MYLDVSDYVASSDICQRANPSRPKMHLPLSELNPPARQYGDRFDLDLVDMPRSTAGHVAICTIVDTATGFVIDYPCFNKTHHGVLDALLLNVFPNFGCPCLLVTDKGKKNIIEEVWFGLIWLFIWILRQDIVTTMRR